MTDWNDLDVSPQHLRLIKASGISPEVAAARGYRTVTDSAELRKLGFNTVQSKLVPALWVPTHGVDGTVTGGQIRPDNPRTVRDREMKYESPSGSAARLDVPPTVRHLLADPGVGLWITEGARKADSAVTAGVLCVDLLGVWSWRGTNPQGGKTELADWDAVALNGRTVYLAFDSDVTEKKEVQHALRRLSSMLERRGTTVLVAVLPDGGSGAKVGLDDYLAGGGDVAHLQRTARPLADTFPHQPFTPTDELSIAVAWAEEHKDAYRFDPDEGRWIAWDGRVWRVDKTGNRAQGAIGAFLRDFAASLVSLPSDGAESGSEGSLSRLLSQMQSSSKVKAIAHLAGTQTILHSSVKDDFDQHPYLLNAANGIVDLQTGDLLPHDPIYRLTQITEVEYREDAEAPTFHRFLEDVQPSQAMRTYISRLLGMALVGEVSEHVLPIFYGVGRNGKSVLMNVCLRAMGTYGYNAPEGLLVQHRFEPHPTILAGLHRKRLVSASETADDARLNESLVKKMTGGDSLTARRMNEDFWEFKPSHNIVLLTNHKPDVDGLDSAIWARLKLVPFSVVVPKEKQDPHLESRIAAEELPGVLRWLVSGCIGWQVAGLGEPLEVQMATIEYQAEENHLLTFLGEHTSPQMGETVEVQKLRTIYSNWVEDRRDIEPIKAKKFKDAVAACGFRTGLHPNPKNRRAVIFDMALREHGQEVAEATSEAISTPTEDHSEDKVKINDMTKPLIRRHVLKSEGNFGPSHAYGSEEQRDNSETLADTEVPKTPSIPSGSSASQVRALSVPSLLPSRTPADAFTPRDPAPYNETAHGFGFGWLEELLPPVTTTPCGACGTERVWRPAGNLQTCPQCFPTEVDGHQL